MALLFSSLSSTHYLPFFPKSFPTVSNPLPPSLSLLLSEGRQRQHPQSRRDRDVGDGGQTTHPTTSRASQTAQTFIIRFPSIVELGGELEGTRMETRAKKSVNCIAGPRLREFHILAPPGRGQV